MKISDFTDEQIVAAIGDGARIHRVSDNLGFGPKLRPALRRRLCKLEAAGAVHRCPRYTYFNSIYWRAGPEA